MVTNEFSISEVVACGIAFDPKYSEALQSMNLQDLLESIPRLFEMLDERDIEYVLVGGIAMLVYVAGRNTQDIDIIVSADELERLSELSIVDRKGDFVRGRLGDLQVDVLLADNSLFDKVRRDYSVQQRFVEREIPCASVEGLLLLKLFALPSLYRQGQFDRSDLYERDIAMLIRGFHPDLEPLFEELSVHVLESDLAELRSIVSDIEDRLDRARKRFQDG